MSDTAILTGAISAIVAIAGTIVTFLNRNKDSSDKRLDLAFKVNQELVDDLRQERTELMTRLDNLETSRDTTGKELTRLRDALSEQALEMRVLRQREAELRSWAVDIMGWAAMAVGIIRSMGGTIDNPPKPPAQVNPL